MKCLYFKIVTSQKSNVSDLCDYSMQQLREGVQQDDTNIKKKELELGPKPSYGYGGKFGVEKDRMDKVNCGYSFIILCFLMVLYQNNVSMPYAY